MTLVAMQDGKVIMDTGKVGTGSECCCGGGGGELGACCVCWAGDSFDCIFTQESQNLIQATLSGLGYINVSIGQDLSRGITSWNSQCCADDPEDCTTITAFCAGPDGQWDGVGQVDFTFCRCTSTEGACVDGQTQQQCQDLGGQFHAGATCEDSPCNPLP